MGSLRAAWPTPAHPSLSHAICLGHLLSHLSSQLSSETHLQRPMEAVQILQDPHFSCVHLYEVNVS
jgi:hypothetical protein